MRIRSYAVVCLAIFSTLATFFPSIARAQKPVATASPAASVTPTTTATPLNLTLSPVTLNFETTPGSSQTLPFKIRNNGTEAEQLTISFGTFVADSTGQRPTLLEPKTGDTFMSWLSASESSFSVGPNEWKNVDLTFSPPSEAALSYYYTVIVSRSHATPQPGETVIQGSPALLVLATATSPNAKRELQLEGMTTSGMLLESLPQTFKVRIKNSGNVHISPVGNIFIDGERKKDLAVLSLNAGNNYILPNSAREFEVVWDDPIQEDTDNGPFGINFNPTKKIRWGKYTAHLLLVYDNGERDVPIESYVSFWVIPWRLLLIRLATPIIPALLVFIVMKLKAKTTPPRHE